NRIKKDKIHRLRHEILKEPYVKSNYLKDIGEEPTKKVINKTHIELFQINIIDFIKSGFKLEKLKKENTLVLFIYRDRNLKKCDAFDLGNVKKTIEEE